MQSAEQVVQIILESIARLYDAPETTASTLGELDVLLRELHSLYAVATERFEDYAQIRVDVFMANIPEWRAAHMDGDLHAVLEEKSQYLPIVDEWKRFDAMFGIRV